MGVVKKIAELNTLLATNGTKAIRAADVRELIKTLDMRTDPCLSEYVEHTDGSVDVSAAVQQCIDENPGRLIKGYWDHQYRLDSPIDFKSSYFEGRNCDFLVENVGAVPAINRTSGGGVRWPTVLRDFNVYALNAGYNVVPQSGGGVPHTKFRPGSIGMKAFGSGQSYENISFNNFEIPAEFQENSFALHFRHCHFRGGNWGVRWPRSFSNSGERIIFDECGINNNNYGVYINHTNDTDADGIGNGVSIGAGSFIFIGCSVDYNIVRHVENVILSGANQFDTLVLFLACHIETNDTTTGGAGAVARIRESGLLFLIGNILYEAGSPNTFPPMVDVDGFFTRISTLGNLYAMKGNPKVFELSGGQPQPGRIFGGAGDIDSYGGFVDYTDQYTVKDAVNERNTTTLTQNSTTPDLAYHNDKFVTNNTVPTLVKSFGNGFEGRRVWVQFNDINTTIDVNDVTGNIRGFNNVNWNPGLYDKMFMEFRNGAWRPAKLLHAA